MINYFKILNIEITEDEEVIKDAYKVVLRNNPPTSNVEKYDVIRRAYEVLSDNEKRKNHIAELQIEIPLDELINKCYEALDNENYNELEVLLNKARGLEVRGINEIRAEYAFINNEYVHCIKLYKRLIKESTKYEAFYENRKIYSLIKIGEVSMVEEALKNYSKNTKDISSAFLEYIDYNILIKDYKKNSEIINEFLKNPIYKITKSRKVILECILIKSNIYQCNFNNINDDLENLTANIMNLEDKDVINFVVNELLDYSDKLLKWEQPKESAMINLFLNKYILKRNYDGIEFFIRICEQYEKAIKEENIDKKLLIKAYLWLNKFKLEEDEKSEVIVRNANNIFLKYIQDNKIKAKEEMKKIKGFSIELYNIAFEE